MAAVDMLLILGCLVIGYMAVSLYLRRGGNDPTKHDMPRPEATPPAARAPPAPPHWSSLLEVGPDASVEEIREGYRRMIARYHPDKVATMGPELQLLANSKTQEITSAYQDAIRERASK